MSDSMFDKLMMAVFASFGVCLVLIALALFVLVVKL